MKIGFIGLGNVGSKLAKSLLKNRYNLTVCDIDKNINNKFKKIGAKISISPSNIAKNNDIIITCLPSPQASSKVLESNDGIINGISKNKIWIEMSTTDSKEVIRLSKLIKKNIISQIILVIGCNIIEKIENPGIIKLINIIPNNTLGP